MTNSELLNHINELRSEIDEETNLCSSFFKLDKINTDSIRELSESVLGKIDLFKKYQAVISKRNMNKTLIFKDKEYLAIDLIKIKEGILLKKQLKQIFISTESEKDDILQIALESFQSIQDYKKSLSDIHLILQEFNNEKFNIEDYYEKN